MIKFIKVQLFWILMSSHFIEFSETSFRYPEQNPTSRDSINSVSFFIDSGEYVAIVGANGSGKTTLVKLIDGLLLPTGGKLEVGGVFLAEGVNLETDPQESGNCFPITGRPDRSHNGRRGHCIWSGKFWNANQRNACPGA